MAAIWLIISWLPRHMTSSLCVADRKGRNIYGPEGNSWFCFPEYVVSSQDEVCLYWTYKLKLSYLAFNCCYSVNFIICHKCNDLLHATPNLVSKVVLNVLFECDSISVFLFKQMDNGYPWIFLLFQVFDWSKHLLQNSINWLFIG